MFECIAGYIDDDESSIPKYAIDPLFTERDRTILSTLGYSILPAQDSCVLSSFLNLQESDRVLCYLPHLPLHLVLSALLSALLAVRFVPVGEKGLRIRISDRFQLSVISSILKTQEVMG